MSNLCGSAPSKYTLRECQVSALSQLEEAWDKYDVFILSCPVASGKSLQAITIGEWLRLQGLSSAIITPQVLLQDQYTQEFPDLPSLKGRSHYCCNDPMYESCEDRFTVGSSYCSECDYVKAKSAVVQAPVGVYNLYSYLFLDRTSDILILDEAHSVASQLQEFYSLKIWQHEDNYPKNLHTQGDAVIWMEKHCSKLELEADLTSDPKERLKLLRKVNKFTRLIRGINRDPGHFFYENKMAEFRGTQRPCIEIRPVTLQHTSRTLWKQHKKIVMMSATLHPNDIEYLGLKGKRCKYIEVDSPIPAANRPIVIKPTAQMTYATLKDSIPKVCDAINNLLEKHQGKGMIHITYGMIPLFKKYLTSDRFMWHTEKTRLSVYEKFRTSKDNRVLVACGMSEGIDLAGVDYEWQVIAKIMFPSLGDALVKRQKEQEPKWYAWQAIKTTIQQTGRICRTPTDYGITYILDSSFVFLYQSNRELFPNYLKEALQWPSK